MALLLPTNLNLPAAAFVDRRTGLAKTVNDLRNWDYENVPIPVGFEVFVDGKWYIYQGQENVTADTLTGYFRERGGINVVQVTGNSTDSVMSQKAVTDQLNTLSDRINEITENLGIILEIREVELLNSEGNPLNQGGGLYEVGEQVSPIFGWKVYYNGVPILASDSSLITGVWLVLENGEENRADGTIIPATSSDEDPYLFQFQSGYSISSNTKFRVRLSFGTGVGQITASLDIDYSFVYRKYWGYTTIPAKQLNSDNVDNFINGTEGKIIGTELSLSRELPLTRFDCSSAESSVYPIYIIPNSVFQQVSGNEIRVLVGSIDVNIYELILNSIFVDRGSVGYSVIAFSVPQKGILNIEIKNYE